MIRDVDFSKVEIPSTFEGMVDRTIAFLNGDGEVPYYGRSGPDDETLPMVPQLIELNRRGLLTTGSQPGMKSDGIRQRSWVEGYAHDDVAYALWRTGNELGLLVNICDLRTPYVHRREAGYPVSYRGGHPFTFVGRYPVRFPWQPWVENRPRMETDNGYVLGPFDTPEPWRSELHWVIAMDATWERPAHTQDGILTKLLSCLEPSQ